MIVPIELVGRTGRMNLVFGRRNGRTVLLENYGEAPLKITRLNYPDNSDLAQLILMHTTAGLFGGDSIDLSIRLESGSRVLICSQSSLKVHPANDASARQRVQLQVDRDAEIHLYNDPLIPFADSRLIQTFEIDLDEQARFYSWEGFMAGRVARGEAWRFALLSSETRLAIGGTLAHLERFRIEPAHSSPARRWVMSDHTYFRTAIFYDCRIKEDFCEALHELIPEAGVDQPRPGLLLIRVAAKSGLALRSMEVVSLERLFAFIGERFTKTAVGFRLQGKMSKRHVD